MSEESKPGTPPSPGENYPSRPASLECTEFEALLTGAMEGSLSHEAKAHFETHRRSCAACGPLFDDVEAGRLWLRSLEPVEPPTYLVHNILASTTGVVGARMTPARSEASTAPLAERIREWWDSWFAPAATFVRQPRFVMSFGMIFFMGSLSLSLAGVKPSDVAKVDLRPSALRHAYNGAQIKIVQYYDNIHYVYEIESMARALKRATVPAEPGPTEKKPNRNDNNTSGQPDLKQDRNYSQEQTQIVLAGFLEGSDSSRLPAAPNFEPRASSNLVIARNSQLVARGSRRYL